MKKTILLFITIFLPTCFFAQTFRPTAEDKTLIKELKAIQKNVLKNQDISLYDAFAKANPTASDYVYSYFFALKTSTFTKLKRDILYNKCSENPKREVFITSILNDYQKGIDTCQWFSLKGRIARLHFLEHVASNAPLYEKEFTDLSKLGYKPHQIAPSIGVIYGLDNGINHWLGVSFSISKFYQAPYFMKLQDAKGKTMAIAQKSVSSFDILPITYSYNPKEQFHDASLSLLQFDAPIFINVTKFGFIRKTNYAGGLFYYRPEIGIGYKHFSLIYGKTIFLNKQSWEAPSRNRISIAYLPIVKKLKR
jgi:hypothetical protein